MEKWECCRIGYRADGKPFITFYSPTGVGQYVLERVWPVEREDYELWKKAPGRMRTWKETYLVHRAVALLLADGWEPWQIDGGSWLFKRPFSEAQDQAYPFPTRHAQGYRELFERWRAQSDPVVCPNCGVIVTAGATRCGSCGTWVGPEEDSGSGDQLGHDS